MRPIFIYCLSILIVGCSNPKEESTTVTFRFIPFYTGKIFLEKLPAGEEKMEVIDSAILDLQTDELVFTIPQQEERVFQLRIEKVPHRIYFINDVEHIDIYSKLPDLTRYYFKYSAANINLRIFLDEQRLLSDSIVALEKRRNGLQSAHPESYQRIGKSIDSLMYLAKMRDLRFADTTKSAGAFLFVINRIDFARDFTGLKEFITKAARRFPGHLGIQHVNEEGQKFIRIMQEEYEVGEQLPELVLPDQNNAPFSLRHLKGKYVFIDFWSTWCPQCLRFITVKNKIADKYPDNELEIVSIALDSEKELWKQMIVKDKIPGIHLIDEKMWKGKAAETLKLDSIPFNFLISPEGKILAKAANKDSILPLLAKWIK